MKKRKADDLTCIHGWPFDLLHLRPAFRCPDCRRREEEARKLGPWPSPAEAEALKEKKNARRKRYNGGEKV